MGDLALIPVRKELAGGLPWVFGKFCENFVMAY